MFNKFFIIITGPTGVGKTDFADILSKTLNFKTEILNADLGQFYTPLNIGSAKPDLKNKTNYSLFNILNEPKNFTAYDFRNLIINKIEQLWDKKIIPIIVGGSMFYIKSIFFPPQNLDNQKNKNNLDLSLQNTQELYNQLNSIDPIRASQINNKDRYRIERALDLWYQTGQKPSELSPKFSIPFNSKGIIYYINRDRQELYNIINKRTKIMFDLGFIEEVNNLDHEWKEFLIEKKIIGYNDIVNYIKNLSFNNINKINIENLIEQISRRTRNYAKRQIIFWNKLKSILIKLNQNNLLINEINLNELKYDLHINKLKLNLEKELLNVI